MFYTDQLLSKEGPLAHVWLAANLEKKLSKQQLLSTNITKSAKAIVSSSSSHLNTNSQSQSTDVHPIALRLSGQLLLGVVRIYSRKAKYLLDDVNEILLKLKTSFRSNQSVTLPPQQTILPSVRNLMLIDQVTETDLLYQEPLNLNFEDLSSQNVDHLRNDIFQNSQQNADSLNNSSFDYNVSIELRRGGDVDELANEQNDDFNFDFDLGDEDHRKSDEIMDDDENINDHNTTDLGLSFDKSIEVGRSNEEQIQQQDLSVLPDLSFSQPSSPNPPNVQEEDFQQDFDMGGWDDQPIEEAAPPTPAHSDDHSLLPQTPTSPTELPIAIENEVITTREKKKRTSKLAVTENGIRTNKRKLIIDSEISIDSDILRQPQLSNFQSGNANEDELTLSEKLYIIKELSDPLNRPQLKKIWDVTDDIKRRCIELARQNSREETNFANIPDDESRRNSAINEAANLMGGTESDMNKEQNAANEFTEGTHNNENDFQQDFTMGDWDNEMEPLALEDRGANFENPSLEPASESSVIEPNEEDFDEFLNSQTPESISKSTIKVASQLRYDFSAKQDLEQALVTDLTTIIEKDVESNEPLSKFPNREAARCFFELLVLSTGDAIELKQDRLFGEIEVTAKSNIFSKFM